MLSTQPSRDQVPVPFPGIAWEMPAVDDPDGKLHASLQRGDLLRLFMVCRALNQLISMDDIAGEDDIRGSPPQRDAAGGVVGGVDHLQVPVAKVDDVAIPQRRRVAGAPGSAPGFSSRIDPAEAYLLRVMLGSSHGWSPFSFWLLLSLP